MIQLSLSCGLGSGCSVCPPPLFPCPNNLVCVVKSNQCQCIHEIVQCLLFSWMPEIVIF